MFYVRARIDWCKQMLGKYKDNASKNVYNIITGHESWIYIYEPETKQQSIIWLLQDEQYPVKAFALRALPYKWSRIS